MSKVFVPTPGELMSRMYLTVTPKAMARMTPGMSVQRISILRLPKTCFGSAAPRRAEKRTALMTIAAVTPMKMMPERMSMIQKRSEIECISVECGASGAHGGPGFHCGRGGFARAIDGQAAAKP